MRPIPALIGGVAVAALMLGAIEVLFWASQPLTEVRTKATAQSPQDQSDTSPEDFLKEKDPSDAEQLARELAESRPSLEELNLEHQRKPGDETLKNGRDSNLATSIKEGAQ